MQGRDPDHDETGPGQGPPPSHGGPAHPGYGGFPVPDNPYGVPEGDDAGREGAGWESDGTGTLSPPPPTVERSNAADEARQAQRGLFEPRRQAHDAGASQPPDAGDGSQPPAPSPLPQQENASREPASAVSDETPHRPAEQQPSAGQATEPAGSAPEVATEAFQPLSGGSARPEGGPEPAGATGDKPPPEPPAPPPEPPAAAEPAAPAPGPAASASAATERFGEVRAQPPEWPAGDESPAGHPPPAAPPRAPAGESPTEAFEAGRSPDAAPQPATPDSFTERLHTVQSAGPASTAHQATPPGHPDAAWSEPRDAAAGAGNADPPETGRGPQTETHLSTQPPPGPSLGQGPGSRDASVPGHGAPGAPHDRQPPPPSPYGSPSPPYATDPYGGHPHENGPQPPYSRHPQEQGPQPRYGEELAAYGTDPYGPPLYGRPARGDDASHHGPGVPPYQRSGPGGGPSHPSTGPPASTSVYDFDELRAKPKRRRRGLLAASVVLAVFLALGGGAFAYAAFLGGSGETGGPFAVSSTPAESEAAAGRHSPAPPSPSFDPAKIRTGKTDKKPLRLREQFPDKTVTVGGHTLQRVAMNMTKKCAKAGQPGFDKALRRAGCQRILRATFVDKKTKYAITAGVAVLPTKARAAKVEKAANARKNIWFSALRGPKGSGAEKIHRSGGYSALDVLGRYAIFSFAAYADKIKLPPESKDLSRLCARMRDYAAEPIVGRGMVTPRPTAD